MNRLKSVPPLRCRAAPLRNNDIAGLGAQSVLGCQVFGNGRVIAATAAEDGLRSQGFPRKRKTLSEENTKDLTQDEKLDLILAEIRGMKADIRSLDTRLTAVEGRQAALEARQASFEEKVGDRLLDTRPPWEVINARTEMLVEQVAEIKEQNARMEEKLTLINHQLEEMTIDLMEMRGGQRELRKRVSALEQRPS